jgi:hypothetical protein
LQTQFRLSPEQGPQTFPPASRTPTSGRARVNELLTGPVLQIPSQLTGVGAVDDNDPEETLEILNGRQRIQLLGELVASGTPITHEVLGELTQNMHVHHLRYVLVHTGALNQQGDGLQALEPWMRSLFAGLSPQTAAVLRPYAC